MCEQIFKPPAYRASWWQMLIAVLFWEKTRYIDEDGWTTTAYHYNGRTIVTSVTPREAP